MSSSGLASGLCWFWLSLFHAGTLSCPPHCFDGLFLHLLFLFCVFSLVCTTIRKLFHPGFHQREMIPSSQRFTAVEAPGLTFPQPGNQRFSISLKNISSALHLGQNFKGYKKIKTSRYPSWARIVKAHTQIEIHCSAPAGLTFQCL